MREILTDDGTRLSVQDTGGDGRPVVLVHGWPLSAASWSHQVPALVAAGHRVITYDRRGFGDSDPAASGTYDYETLAADLASVLTQLGLEDVSLVGFSMGGGEVVRHLARQGSAGVRSAVLVAAVPPYLLQTDDNPDGPLPRELAAELRGGLEQDRDGFLPNFLEGFFSAGEQLMVGREDVEEALAMARRSDQEAALATMDAWATTDFRDDLGAIDVPLLVLHGDSDATVPVEGSGARVHAAVPGSELVVLEVAPHGLLVSHADAVNRTLVEFLGR